MNLYNYLQERALLNSNEFIIVDDFNKYIINFLMEDLGMKVKFNMQTENLEIYNYETDLFLFSNKVTHRQQFLAVISQFKQ